MEKIRVLFVCHGNICRSPMAEFILKDMAEKRGLSDRLYIASAATSYEEIGNPVYGSARRKLREHGISAEGKTAVRLTREDYDKYDYLIGMDTENISNMIIITGRTDKIYKLLEFAGVNRDVSDPWFTENFDKAYDDIYTGCAALLDRLEGELNG